MNIRRLLTPVVFVALTVGLPTGRADAATRNGSVVVVDAKDTRTVLSSGDHETAFTLRLPTGATCPGDSMHDDWRVQTFLVPATDDPGLLTYTVAVTGPDGPQDDARVSLYSTEGRPYVQQLLGANTEAGRPGEIPQLPAFSFKRLPVDYLPSGDYSMGIACTDFQSKTVTYWDTAVRITSSSSTMSWTVTADQPASNNGSNARLLTIVLAAIGVLLGLAAVVLWRRNARGERGSGEPA